MPVLKRMTNNRTKEFLGLYRVWVLGQSDGVRAEVLYLVSRGGTSVKYRQGTLRMFVLKVLSNWALLSQCGALSAFLVVNKNRPAVLFCPATSSPCDLLHTVF